MVSTESRVDITIFGATGFTGKIVVENLVKMMKLCKDGQYSDLRWSVAGRSVEKLQLLFNEFRDSGMYVNVDNIPTITADVTNEDSLKAMTEKTKVLINCTGPYTVLGEPVVKACIATGTHYVDISAELHNMLDIYKKFHKEAEDANVLIIPACGYGSIPAVMGLTYLEKHFEGSLNSVECYSALDISKRLYFPGCNKTLVHYGTWASLVYELQNFRNYMELKKVIFPGDIYDSESEKIERSFFHRHQGKYWFRYPGPDHDVIEMGQRYLQEKKNKKPVYFNIYTTMPAFFHLILIIPAFFMYYYLSFFGCFRKLLWKFPRFFTFGYMSHKGPSVRNRLETKFSFVLTGTGQGYKDAENGINKTQSAKKKMSVKVSGIDPYGITAVAVALSAITVLKDQSQMPRGGVIFPGAAFCDTSLVDRLNSNNLQFELLQEDALSS